MQNNDVTVRRKSYAAAKEIKASAHYAYVVNGITLDGSKFETGGFVEEGTCLVKDNTTGKYEPYKDTASAFPTGKSINRIRLEFKGVQKSMKTRQVEVLIESDWNLKN